MIGVALLAVGVITLILLVDAALMIPSALSARRAMESGRAALEAAQRSLSEGDATGAAEAFASAKGEFDRAASAASSLPMRLGRMVPVAGRTPGALHDLALAGGHIADAGSSVSEGIAALPDGVASLAPERGRIPISRIEQLAPDVASAVGSLQQAQEIAGQIPTDAVVEPVAEAARLLRGRLDDILPVAESADSMLTALPDFAGLGGTKRYFVAGVNPSEMRGTGGFIGVWSILTIKDGKIRLAPFRDVADLPAGDPARLPALDDDMLTLYGGSGLPVDWRATNMMPDAPTAAGFVEDLWRATQPTQLDGVVFVNPQALAALLSATGPVYSNELGTELSSDNVVSIVASKAYNQFGYDTEARKQALGLAAGTVWDRFLRTAPPGEALKALGAATTNGDLLLHATDPRVQQAFEEAGVAGAWRADASDFFGTSVNNAAANKVDYYLRQSLHYDVTLRPDGRAEATASITLHNDAPRNAKPGYDMGPPVRDVPGARLNPGENYTILETYCATDCLVTDSTIDDEPLGFSEGHAFGLTVQSTALTIKPQQTRELAYDYSLADVWEGNLGDGIYTLRIRAQRLVHPTTASVAIHLPEGTRVLGTSDNATASDSTVTFDGEMGDEIAITVRFGQPWLARTWSGIWRFLDTPVIEL